MSAPVRLLSSGDLLLDRRFDYAALLSAEGDHAAAADLLAGVMELAPDWLPGWMALGEAAERSRDARAAEAAYRAAATLDHDGRFGAALHLARLTGRATALSPAYVAALFDDYAPRFERHLVETLGYSAPAAIVDALATAAAPARFERALDLGCGTGLMGRAIRDRVAWLGGVDLSPAMIEQARAAAVYDVLAVEPLEDALAARPSLSLDLLLAADVLVYCGPLDEVAALAARVLAPGGWLAFTVQAAAEGVPLGSDMRFSHSEAHVRAALAGAGLVTAHLAAVSTRREAGRPVPGLVVVAHRP